MMKAIATLFLFAAFLSTTGCIAAAIASGNKARAHDREAFAKTNMEREAAGLPPLTKKQYMDMAGGGGTVPTTTFTTTSPDGEETTVITSGGSTPSRRHVNIR